ncbi:flagellar brake protein [Spirochaeta africana]|uniref:Putative glycosyltransferase n=1 Tax=Spirochaeta africana (strain ATCC 700263 / DSM 8902 / Z-7692) TaxID=889378 RepID=H9UL52_SPIAZ|nr:PilZ domain-containing protein [Spirochaeta africana]AFG38245.1 putative glycosyltransferase [Spirochaeta africana DSM 8902]
MTWLILGIVLLLAVIGVAVLISRGGFRFPWVQFYVKGKESGFSFKEVSLLRKVAQQNRLKNPASLFWSERALDRCIRGTITRFRATNSEETKENSEFLQQLFGFRKRVEFNQPKYRLGITSSRSINAGQPLKITFPGGGVYIATVVENIRRYLAISYPKGKTLPMGFSWKGQTLRIYFWRPEDAGYYFESKVVGDYMDRKFPILHISHSDNLVRSQKRGSVRREIKKPATLLPLQDIRNSNEDWEPVGGYRGRTMDISEDGIAVMVGGKAKPGLPVKIQTEVAGHQIVMCGVVRGVTFRKKNNVSVLHIQSVPLSVKQRNAILTYVYGIFETSVRKYT